MQGRSGEREGKRPKSGEKFCHHRNSPTSSFGTPKVHSISHPFVTMPKNLAKLQKKISKKKGNITSLNENSRDSQRLRRAGARGEKLEKLAAARAKANQPHSMHCNLPQMLSYRTLNFYSAKGGIFPRSRKSHRWADWSGEDRESHREVGRLYYST